MNPSDLSNRQLFKFTGPPENWLTAIKYMTWGLEEKYLNRWQEIEAGDIFLMHSTSTNTRIKDARSSIIGFGVVSPEFRRKDGPLWVQEIESHKNIWPLLIPFSEIYLFSELRPPGSLEAPNSSNSEVIISETRELLSSAVGLPEGFPQMGSFARVQDEVVVKIFEQVGKFYLYESAGEVAESFIKPLVLKEVRSASDIIRKPATLSELDVIKRKTVKLGKASYTKDFDTLERAETAHHETLSKLLDLLKSRGFTAYSNQHVDLFGVRGNESYLFEVKSFNKRNFFCSQSRKGIVQLFEYEYFEIRKFFGDQHKDLAPQKALVYSDSPSDTNYIGFINNLKLGAGYFENKTLRVLGQTSSFMGLL